MPAHKIVVTGELSPAAVRQALEKANRPVLQRLRVSRKVDELIANVIVYGRSSPYHGAQVELDSRIDEGTWELIA